MFPNYINPSQPRPLTKGFDYQLKGSVYVYKLMPRVFKQPRDESLVYKLSNLLVTA